MLPVDAGRDRRLAARAAASSAPALAPRRGRAGARARCAGRDPGRAGRARGAAADGRAGADDGAGDPAADHQPQQSGGDVTAANYSSKLIARIPGGARNGSARVPAGVIVRSSRPASRTASARRRRRWPCGVMVTRDPVDARAATIASGATVVAIALPVLRHVPASGEALPPAGRYRHPSRCEAGSRRSASRRRRAGRARWPRGSRHRHGLPHRRSAWHPRRSSAWPFRSVPGPAACQSATKPSAKSERSGAQSQPIRWPPARSASPCHRVPSKRPTIWDLGRATSAGTVATSVARYAATPSATKRTILRDAHRRED